MTRINSAINVKYLTDEHLLAEHREIKRMVYSYMKRKSMKSGFSDIPPVFTLGKGHVIFFIDKGMFTFKRYLQIHDECLHRRFNVTNYSNDWIMYTTHFNDYSPTRDEHALLVDRISERLINSTKKCWHYYGQKISKEQSVNLLKYGTI